MLNKERKFLCFRRRPFFNSCLFSWLVSKHRSCNDMQSLQNYFAVTCFVSVIIVFFFFSSSNGGCWFLILLLDYACFFSDMLFCPSRYTHIYEMTFRSSQCFQCEWRKWHISLSELSLDNLHIFLFTVYWELQIEFRIWSLFVCWRCKVKCNFLGPLKP